MMKYAPVALLGAILAACASAPPPHPIIPPTPAVSEADYTTYTPGAGILEGQAFLKTRGGEVRFAAGNAITLDPITPATRHWWTHFARLWVYRNALPKTGALKHRLTETADAEGRFRFEHLAEGQQYYLRTVHTWEAGVLGTTGSVLAKEVTIKSGEPTKVVLTAE